MSALSRTCVHPSLYFTLNPYSRPSPSLSPPVSPLYLSLLLLLAPPPPPSRESVHRPVCRRRQLVAAQVPFPATSSHRHPAPHSRLGQPITCRLILVCAFLSSCCMYPVPYRASYFLSQTAGVGSPVSRCRCRPPPPKHWATIGSPVGSAAAMVAVLVSIYHSYLHVHSSRTCPAPKPPNNNDNNDSNKTVTPINHTRHVAAAVGLERSGGRARIGVGCRGGGTGPRLLYIEYLYVHRVIIIHCYIKSCYIHTCTTYTCIQCVCYYVLSMAAEKHRPGPPTHHHHHHLPLITTARKTGTDCGRTGGPEPIRARRSDSTSRRVARGGGGARCVSFLFLFLIWFVVFFCAILFFLALSFSQCRNSTRRDRQNGIDRIDGMDRAAAASVHGMVKCVGPSVSGRTDR